MIFRVAISLLLLLYVGPTARTPEARLRQEMIRERVTAWQQQMRQHAIVTARVETLFPVRNTFRSVTYYEGSRLYEAYWIGNMVEEQSYDRAQRVGWERHFGYVNDLAPTDILEMRQSVAHSHRLLALLKEPGTRVVEIGMATLPDGRKARRLRLFPPVSPIESDLNAPEAVPTDFYLHPQTDHLLAIGYRDRNPRRGTVSDILNLIVDWQPVSAGLPFAYPHKILLYEDGALIERVVTLKVDIHTPIDAGRFARPVEKDHFSPTSKLPTHVPLTFVRGYCIVTVQVNHAAKPGRFLLDTGAGASTITLPMARRLGLPLGASVTNYSGLGNFKSRTSQVKSLRVGDAEVRGLPLDVVTDEAVAQLTPLTGEPLDGILGNDFLRAFLATVDYGGKNGPELLLQRPDASAPAGIAVPFFFSGGSPAVVAHFPGLPPLTMTVDTGASTTWLPPRYVLLLPADRRVPFDGLFGEMKGTRLIWLPEITLRSAAAPASPQKDEAPSSTETDVTLHDQLAWSQAANKSARPTGLLLNDEYEGLFGSDLLRHFRVTFDYRRSVLIFEKLEHPAVGRGDYIGVGIWPEFKAPKESKETRKRAFVKKLWPFSAAARMGVCVGDELIEIEGKSAQTLTEFQVADYLWRGKEGQILHLSVRQRNGERRTLELEYHRLF